MSDLVALAERLSAAVAAVPGVQAVYARRGVVAIAVDVVARVATGVAPGAHVVVHERDGVLQVEATVGVDDGAPAAVTAALVRSRLLELLSPSALQSHVTVRVATIG